MAKEPRSKISIWDIFFFTAQAILAALLILVILQPVYMKTTEALIFLCIFPVANIILYQKRKNPIYFPGEWESILLTLVGVIVFLFPILDFFTHIISPEKAPEIILRLLLMFMGILLAYAGYDRLFRAEILAKMPKTEISVMSEGTSEIFLTAAKVVAEAKEEIRSTNFIFNKFDLSHNEHALNVYFDKVISKISQGVSYHCIFSSKRGFEYRQQSWTPEKVDHIDPAKIHLYDIESATPRINPRILNSFFDFIIVDDKYALIALPQNSGNTLKSMLKIDGNTESGRKYIKGLTEWYDSLREYCNRGVISDPKGYLKKLKKK